MRRGQRVLPQGCRAGHPLATEGDQRHETTSAGGAEVHVFGFSGYLLDIRGESREGFGCSGDKEVAETRSSIVKISGSILPLRENGSLQN